MVSVQGHTHAAVVAASVPHGVLVVVGVGVVVEGGQGRGHHGVACHLGGHGRLVFALDKVGHPGAQAAVVRVIWNRKNTLVEKIGVILVGKLQLVDQQIALVSKYFKRYCQGYTTLAPLKVKHCSFSYSLS